MSNKDRAGLYGLAALFMITLGGQYEVYGGEYHNIYEFALGMFIGIIGWFIIVFKVLNKIE